MTLGGAIPSTQSYFLNTFFQSGRAGGRVIEKCIESTFSILPLALYFEIGMS
jgi:hypothetical protein